jgi:hypothetical protein
MFLAGVYMLGFVVASRRRAEIGGILRAKFSSQPATS